MGLDVIDSNAFFIAVALYFAAMTAVGAFFYRKNRNVSDYILGGRKLGACVTSLSAEASDMSAWLLMGLPGLAYIAGSGALWIVFGLIIGTYCNWKFVAGRLRRYTELAGDSLTIPDFLQNRFCSSSGTIRVLSAIFVLIFFVIYVSAGFVAGGKFFSLILPISYTHAMLATAIVTALYTLAGGFLAVCWTDSIQGIMMFFAVIAVPLLAVHHLGGTSATVHLLSVSGDGFLNPLRGANNQALSCMEIISMLAWGLGYFGQPHILVRFMAVKEPSELPLARNIAMCWVTLSLFAATTVGILGRVWQGFHLDGANTENVFFLMSSRVCSKFFMCLILLGVLATIMSTVSSQLLVASSSFSRDIYGIIRKHAPQGELLWISRLTVFVVSILAVILAVNPGSYILKIVGYAWAGFGACLGPALLFALFYRRTTERGILAGILVGGVSVMVCKYSMPHVYEIIPAFLLSAVSIFVVTHLDGIPDRKILEIFDSVKKLN
ncbi:MAG: sodium/proline symporter PutP [Puniceicoccales bacterium]|jgi:sodium/proline symporter|nr:sodium/proline symporter PutP [Puniceicoccales bacterium]